MIFYKTEILQLPFDVVVGNIEKVLQLTVSSGSIKYTLKNRIGSTDIDLYDVFAGAIGRINITKNGENQTEVLQYLSSSTTFQEAINLIEGNAWKIPEVSLKKIRIAETYFKFAGFVNTSLEEWVDIVFPEIYKFETSNSEETNKAFYKILKEQFREGINDCFLELQKHCVAIDQYKQGLFQDTLQLIEADLKVKPPQKASERALSKKSKPQQRKPRKEVLDQVALAWALLEIKRVTYSKDAAWRAATSTKSMNKYHEHPEVKKKIGCLLEDEKLLNRTNQRYVQMRNKGEKSKKE